MQKSIMVTINLEEKKEFNHFYSAVGYANTDYTYTKPSQRMYDYLSSFHNHFHYMRMHNILTSHGKGDYYLLEDGQDYGNPGHNKREGGFDSVVSIGDNGQLDFDWTVVDRVYDILLDNGIRPIVETVYLPTCLRKSSKYHSIPKDYQLWYQLIQEFVKHVQQRYGKEEVEQWYFEIWNEPDNRDYWVENPQTFLALYDYMVAAVDSVNPEIKVGGPAVKQGDGAKEIFHAFLEHCSEGLNYATGKFGTRVDFISVHCKGGWPNHYNPSTEVMFNSVVEYLDILKEYPHFDGIEFMNDESDIVWQGNSGVWKESWLNFRNTHYFPGFVCKMVNRYCDIVEDKYGVNLSIVDSDNCHLQWEKYLYSGNRSQFTPLVSYPSTDIIKKPAFNGYVLLSRLGKQRLAVQCTNDDFSRKFGVLPTMTDDCLSVMVWNFEDGIEDNVNTRKVELSLEKLTDSLKNKSFKMVHYRIDSEHSNSYSIWNKNGKPEEPTIEQIKEIREKAGLELYEPVSDVKFTEDFTIVLDMPMHSVSLLLFIPESTEVPTAISFIKAEVEKGYNNRQVFLKWEPNHDEDFLYYRIYRRGSTEEEYQVISDNKSLNTATYLDMDVATGEEYSYKIITVNASSLESEFSEVVEVVV